MANSDIANRYEIGLIGLDPRGRHLAQAIAANRFSIVAFDGNKENVAALKAAASAKGLEIQTAADLKDFMGALRKLRTVLVVSPTASSEFLSGVAPYLEAGDLLIDAGHCYFKDCARRSRQLIDRNIRYLTLALAGDEEGLGGGSVLMAGGRPEVYESARPLLHAIARKIGEEPCVSYFGPPAAAHFVKMVYDGIEYGLMQLLSETFELMKRSLNLEDEELHDVSGAWHMGVLNGYLMEITGHVFHQRDSQTGQRKLEHRLQSARADNRARWTSQTARELGTPTPTIDAAVGLHAFPPLEAQKNFASTASRRPLGLFRNDMESILNELHGALCAAMLITYAEGIAVLATGSERYGFNFDLGEVARVWKGCCSLRTTLLDDIGGAIRATPDLPNLLFDEDLSEKVMEQQERLRHAVWRAFQLQTPVPALMASLDYLDSYRGAWLPTNLIQATPSPLPLSRADVSAPLIASSTRRTEWNEL